MALGVVRAVRDLGLSIPGDLSLIAHDDVFPWLKPENFSVPSSTPRSSMRLAGARVAERLAARISGLEEGARGEVWPVDLVVRVRWQGHRGRASARSLRKAEFDASYFA